MEKCEFCSKEVKYTASTTFFGSYCYDCIKIVMSECEEALEKLEEEFEEL